MKLLDHFRRRRNTPVYNVTSTGAIGGTPPRVQPEPFGQIFTILPMGNILNSGIAPRIAARPPSGTMLPSAAYHTAIPTGTGFVGLNRAIPFHRTSEAIVSPQAVDAATHLTGNVHPGIRRAALRGDTG